MTILVNTTIPRTMTHAGLEYLGRLASSVPLNGTIIEIGPLFGSSTWVLAKNSLPSVRVVSVDTWEPQPWISKVEADFPGCMPFSKQAFEYYVRDCENVTAVQGWSPAVLSDWSSPIDMFFDDATHGDPGFSMSLNHYVPKIVPGGIACGDDFASGWPDIVKGVTRLAQSWNTSPEVIGRVWALLKPDEVGNSSSVWTRIRQESHPHLELIVGLDDGQQLNSNFGVWAGALHQARVIQSVQVTMHPMNAVIDGMFQLSDATGATSNWQKFGESIELKNPMTGFRARLTGRDSDRFSIYYQICSVEFGAGRPKTRNTRLMRDGEWVREAQGRPTPVCALRCLVRKAKVDSRS